MLFWCKVFVHFKLKLLDFQSEFVLRLFGIIIMTDISGRSHSSYPCFVDTQGQEKTLRKALPKKKVFFKHTKGK